MGGRSSSREQALPWDTVAHGDVVYVGTRADLLSRTVDEANAEELRLGQFVREHRICP
jgi:hypothetical protein